MLPVRLQGELRPHAEESALRTLALLLIATLTALLGCQSLTDPLGRQQALELSQRNYTNLVRWGDLARASQFVDAELREDFLARASEFQDIRFTDADALDLAYDGEDEVHVTVTYHGYSIRTAMEHRFQEQQTWVRASGLDNQWQVKTNLAEALEVFGGGS